LLFATVALFIAGCDRDANGGPSPALPAADSIDSVVVEVWDESHAVIEEKRTTDRRAIESLLAALGSGQPVPPHKCAGWGRILLHPSTGKVVELRILPGHDNDRCEFRREGVIFSMPRAAFADALGLLGVKQIPDASP